MRAMGPFRRRQRGETEQFIDDVRAQNEFLVRQADRAQLGLVEAQQARVAVERWLESEDHAPMSGGWASVGFAYTDQQEPESDEDGHAITDAMVVGYALWQVILGRSTSTVPQATIDRVRAAEPEQTALLSVVQAILAESFAELRCLPDEAWNELEAWAWRHAAGRSTDRRQMAYDDAGARFFGIAADVDYETAFRVGYSIGCGEAITGPLDLPDEPAKEVEYVQADQSTVQGIAHLLAGQAIENVEVSIEKWADILLFHAFPDVVLSLRDDNNADDRDAEDSISLAFTAARLGWFGRAAEFAFLEEMGINENLIGVLRRSAARPDNTWMGAARSAASALMNVSRMPTAEREQPTADELLAPIGVGDAVREDMITRLIGALVINDAGDVVVPDGIVIPELDVCVRYGYYMHACQSAMPEEAYVELDTYAEPA
jgi:hypothetical protein